MGLSMIATTEGEVSPRAARLRKRMTRAERRQQRPTEIHGDNGATEAELESFLHHFSPDDRYAAGLPELGRWSPLQDQHYRPEDLDQLAHDLLHAQVLAQEPGHLAALQEAADLVRRCRENAWHLHVAVD